MADDALTAVTGVVLIVAVTFVVSAGIWAVLNGQVEEETQALPGVSWVRHEDGDLIQVVTAPERMPWSEYRILADQELRFSLGHPTMASTAVGPGNSPLMSGAFLEGGDEVRFCGAAGSEPHARTGVTVDLVHGERVVHSFLFADIAACPA